MKNLTYLFVIITLTVSQLSCQLFETKPKNEKFYCKVGGKKFRPDNGGDIFFEPLLFQLNQTSGRFNMTAMNSETGEDNIAVVFSIPIKNNILEARKYELSQEGKGYCNKGYTTNGGVSVKHGYETYPSSGYIIFSKVDTLKKRVSGTFHFKAKSLYTKDEIAVTDGQFNDVFYY
jgi:hypothetical protein